MSSWLEKCRRCSSVCKYGKFPATLVCLEIVIGASHWLWAETPRSRAENIRIRGARGCTLENKGHSTTSAFGGPYGVSTCELCYPPVGSDENNRGFETVALRFHFNIASWARSRPTPYQFIEDLERKERERSLFMGSLMMLRELCRFIIS